MERLRNIQIFQERLYLILPLFLSGLIFLALLVFAIATVLPQIRARVAVVQELELMQSSLKRLQQTQREDPEKIRGRLQAVEGNLQKLGQGLLSEPEVGLLLNSIYEKADANGVVITDVQAQPGAKPSRGTPYEMRAFRISAHGSTTHLLAFLNDVSHLTGEAVQLSNLTLESATLDGSDAQLAVDVVMYIFIPPTALH